MLDPYMAPADVLLSALTPILNNWGMTGESPNFTVDRVSAFGVAVTSNTGLKYGIDPSRLSIEFVHQLRLKAISAGPPTAELTSIPLPFTTLLPEITNRLIDATMMLPSIKTRSLRRVGIVSTTLVDEAAMPPGIIRFIEYMGRPWEGKVNTYNMSVVSELSKRSGVIDSCSHNLVKTRNPEQLPVLQFDWHRVFETGRAVNQDELRQVLRNATDSALNYFEDLAEGNRFDENIIRSSGTTA